MENSQPENDLERIMAEEERENDEEQKQREPKAELQSILDSFTNYADEILDDDVFIKIAPLIDSISEEIWK